MSKAHSKIKIKKKNTLRAKRNGLLVRRSKKSAIERAIEYGIDVTLLEQNLKLSPTEKVLRAQAALESVVAMQSEVKTFRAKQKQA